MKKYKPLIIIVVLIAAGAMALLAFFHKKDAQIVLETTRPQYGYIASSVTATGTIEPVDTVSVGTQISGTVKEVNADYNSAVKKGELIAQIDPSLVQAQVNQYEANLSQSRSDLQYQQSNFNRQSLLYNAGAISKADYETAQNQYNVAKANVASVTAQLQAAQKNLSFTRIYSPIDGVVLTRNVSVGQTVAASFNTPTLFVIAKDLTKMQVNANVDEADIGNVKKQERVTFNVDAYPNDTFPGIVQEIRMQPNVSANVVTYTTIIDAPNAAMKLKPGMTANITIYTQEENNALLVPAKALKFKPDSATLSRTFILRGSSGRPAHKSSSFASGGSPAGKKAYTGNGSSHPGDSTVEVEKASVWVKHLDTLVQRPILIGLNDGINVQVIHGLAPDDEVILESQAVTAAVPVNNSTQQKSPFLPQRNRGKK